MAYLNPRSAASKILCPGQSLCYGVKERAREFITGRTRGHGKEETARGIARMRATMDDTFLRTMEPVCQLPKDGEGIWGTLQDEFFSFFPKNIDGEGIWGTLGY
jgi:hypothetical protein